MCKIYIFVCNLFSESEIDASFGYSSFIHSVYPDNILFSKGELFKWSNVTYWLMFLYVLNNSNSTLKLFTIYALIMFNLFFFCNVYFYLFVVLYLKYIGEVYNRLHQDLSVLMSNISNSTTEHVFLNILEHNRNMYQG